MKGMSRFVVAAAIALVCAGPATSQSVFKSVDAEGRVTYSSTPPPDASKDRVEQIEIAPPPTEQERQAATQRAKALQSATKQANEQREKQAATTERAELNAEQQLREAESALQEAKIKGEGDWQYLSTGGRVLKQSYLDRVKDAKLRVDQAVKAVREAGSTQR